MALASILILYVGIGILAAIGTVSITRSHHSPRGERIFLTLLLIPIAALYLAFSSYFGAPAAFDTEMWHVAGMALLALLGLRFPMLAVLGYVLHGGWDIIHELSAIRGPLLDHPLTPIPLAYGVFCATYDWCIAAYLLRERP